MFGCVMQGPIRLSKQRILGGYPRALCIYHSKVGPQPIFGSVACSLAVPTGLLLQGFQGYGKLAGGLLQVLCMKLRSCNPASFFDILMDGCIRGGGIGQGIRKLGPIPIYKPFYSSCLSLMAGCSTHSACHHSTEF
jgi:hypothetical protein